MIKLNLVRISPPSNETHLVSLILGVLSFTMAYATTPTAGLPEHISTGIVAAVCWYVYKVFDGITYDEQVTPVGTVIGFIIIGIIGYLHFL